VLSFAIPFVVVWIFAQFVFGWPLHQAQIAGIALSTTSVAVVYAVMRVRRRGCGINFLRNAYESYCRARSCDSPFDRADTRGFGERDENRRGGFRPRRS